MPGLKDTIKLVDDFLELLAINLIIFLIKSIARFFVSTAAGNDKILNAGLMGVVGFFIGGAANIISAAICADMGRIDELRGNAEALATVTGIVDGTGSVGAGNN